MGANSTYYVKVEKPVKYEWLEVSALTSFDAVVEVEKEGRKPKEPYEVTRDWKEVENG